MSLRKRENESIRKLLVLEAISMVQISGQGSDWLHDLQGAGESCLFTPFNGDDEGERERAPSLPAAVCVNPVSCHTVLMRTYVIHL